jgi:prepilin-type processing-associated H-X9-DG protein
MEEETGNVAVAEEVLSCASCDISIGSDFIEEKGYPVGDYKLCRFCLSRLAKNGRILLQPYFPNNGVFLFADGHTEKLPLKDKR